jgi:hypothetical protein
VGPECRFLLAAAAERRIIGEVLAAHRALSEHLPDSIPTKLLRQTAVGLSASRVAASLLHGFSCARAPSRRRLRVSSRRPGVGMLARRSSGFLEPIDFK